ncbi:RNA-binding protein Cwf29 [Clarireedia jacksonii]
MNSIRQIQELNKRELEQGIPPSASWHTDYRDTAYIYIGGLPFELSEGDVLTIFSQYGEPTYINLVRDKETGKSRGFAFLKYEDQRSTDLAVDNLGGAVIAGRTLRVDHTRYKRKEGEEDTGLDLSGDLSGRAAEDSQERRKRRRLSGSGSENEQEEQRPLLKEERELALLIRDHDEDDPMKAFLIEEKKEEVARALARVKGGAKSEKEKTHRHRHRSRRDTESHAEREDRHRSKHRRDGDDRDRHERGEGDDGYRSRHKDHRHNRHSKREFEDQKRSPEDDHRRERRSRKERSPSDDGRRRYP